MTRKQKLAIAAILAIAAYGDLYAPASHVIRHAPWRQDVERGTVGQLLAVGRGGARRELAIGGIRLRLVCLRLAARS